MTYNLAALSYVDFEALCRDLLRRHLGLELEIFGPGRDGGVDLRHIGDGSGDIVIQCKHYPGSTTNQLLRKLNSEELPKVKRLAPARYCLATSLPLTPLLKSKIREMFIGLVQSEADIWGRDEIFGMLRDHPDVVREHHKLWLTSTTVLRAVLNQRILGKADGLLDDIEKKASVYVQSSDYSKAHDLLSEHNVCIISGVPGIGKTTLAEMLIADHINRKFYPVVVSEDIDEAMSVYEKNNKQVFYYDDFLGQSLYTETLRKNEDKRLIQFIRKVAQDNSKRFILTTREYILAEAKQNYESLDYANIEFLKFTLDISSYSRLQRAKILYNHIYFSNISQDQVIDLLKDDRYLNIIDHKNYNPRLVEYICNLYSKESSGKTFIQFSKEIFSNPKRVWNHAFENQLDQEDRVILFALFSIGRRSSLDLLMSCFKSYLELDGLLDSKSLMSRFRKLEGSFLRFDKDDGVSFASMHDPSISDYLANYLAENEGILEKIIESAVSFEQVASLFHRAVRNAQEGLPQQDVLRQPIQIRLERLLERLFELWDSPAMTGGSLELPSPWSQMDSRLRTIMDASSQIGLWHQGNVEKSLVARESDWSAGRGDKADVLDAFGSGLAAPKEISELFSDRISLIKRWFIDDADDPYGWIALSQLNNLAWDVLDDSEQSQLEEEVIAYLDAETSAMTLSELLRGEGPDLDLLRTLAEEFGLETMYEDELNSMEAALDHAEEAAQEWRREEGSALRSATVIGGTGGVGRSEIASMFESLGSKE